MRKGGKNKGRHGEREGGWKGGSEGGREGGNEREREWEKNTSQDMGLRCECVPCPTSDVHSADANTRSTVEYIFSLVLKRTCTCTCKYPWQPEYTCITVTMTTQNVLT